MRIASLTLVAFFAAASVVPAVAEYATFMKKPKVLGRCSIRALGMSWLDRRYGVRARLPPHTASRMPVVLSKVTGSQNAANCDRRCFSIAALF